MCSSDLPHTGKFLFNAETVANIPKYYEAVKDMPYLEGNSTPGLYNYTFHQPTGMAMYLRHVIPVRWFLSLPDWTQTLIADQPVWRWCAIAIALASITQASGLGSASAFVGFGLGYVFVYARMVRFHWCSPIEFLLVKPAFKA